MRIMLKVLTFPVTTEQSEKKQSVKYRFLLKLVIFVQSLAEFEYKIQ